MATLHEINACLIEWDQLSKEFRRVSLEHARAEAEYRRLRARKIVEIRAVDSKKPVSLAELEADADDTIYMAHLSRLSAEAERDAVGKRLLLMRARADALRSQLVDERHADSLYSERGNGGL